MYGEYTDPFPIDHAEIVRELAARWNAGDRDVTAMSAYFDPAFELESPLSSVVGEPYRGYAGLERWMNDLDEQFAEWAINLEDVRCVGTQVIAIGTVNARGRASEIALRFTSATVSHFGSDHRVSRMHIYQNVDEAREAVGLEG